MKAIIIGATGAVGSDLLEQLLADERYERVGREDLGADLAGAQSYWPLAQYDADADRGSGGMYDTPCGQW